MKTTSTSLVILLAMIIAAACGSVKPAPTLVTTLEPALTWKGPGWDNNCKSLRLAPDGQAEFGSCEAPQRLATLSHSMDRDGQWGELLSRFAPFQTDNKDEKFIFRGQGAEIASPAWQRAILSWAKIAAQELELGRSSASIGTAVTWREDISMQPGYCKFLEVEMYGYVYSSTAQCEGGEPRTEGAGWLQNEELMQLDFWYYNRAPVDRYPTLNLFSLGSQAMSEDEIDELTHWAGNVHDRISTTPAVQTRAAELNPGFIAKRIEEIPLTIIFPDGYALNRNAESNRRGSFVSYDFIPSTGYRTPYLQEIQFFSAKSIEEFWRNCAGNTPCFFGDAPDLDRYYGQLKAYTGRKDFDGLKLRPMGKSYYFVSNHPCAGDTCMIREYTTFIPGDIKADIWIIMEDESQAAQSDELILLIRLEE